MERVPPGQTLTKNGKWPVLHSGRVPDYDLKTWDFRTWGLVEQPLTLSWSAFQALPRVRVHSDFHCVTTWSRLDMDWEGVSFRTIVEQTRPKPEVRHVMAYGDYDYTTNVPLEVLLDQDVLLATHESGQPLSKEHGFPLRLVVPQRYAWKSAKWLRSLEFMDKDRRGYWERMGYHNNAEPFAEERYSSQE
ncbi:MAG TPA: sulfite oxidase-like oxidoreductase [Planctomycetota bacterium]|nr:sulfite oxidase-like oxidoreductase [Planctomycetota bacterium]